MGKCDLCNKEMLSADGCSYNVLIDKNNKKWNKIKFGDEGEDWGKGKCHDCGCKIGFYHHDGCDAERCPKCNGQLISCDCDFPNIDISK